LEQAQLGLHFTKYEIRFKFKRENFPWFMNKKVMVYFHSPLKKMWW